MCCLRDGSASPGRSLPRLSRDGIRGTETSGLGTIASFVVVHYPVAPALNDVVPYAVALVALEDMPTVRVVGNVLNRGPRDLAIGQRVRAVFEEIPGGDGEETILLPQWEAVE